MRLSSKKFVILIDYIFVLLICDVVNPIVVLSIALIIGMLTNVYSVHVDPDP